MNADRTCVACDGGLRKASEDTVYCVNPACERYGLSTAIGKDENGVVVELRTDEGIE